MRGLTTYRPLREELPMAACQTTKFCTKCKTEKPVEMFSRNARSKDGMQAYCKVCVNNSAADYRLNNREGLREKQRKYIAANRDKKRESDQRYHQANRVRVLEYAKNYRESNKEKISKCKIEWYLKNKDKISEDRSARYRDDPEVANAARKRAREWAENNKERVRIHKRNRKARIRNSPGILSKDISARLLKLQRGKCTCCGKPLGNDYHLDHIIPIALGGTNTDDNVQLLRAECNNFKRAKHPADFMRQRGFLI